MCRPPVLLRHTISRMKIVRIVAGRDDFDAEFP
jgi:hypothetical protein